jgi:hypothetical protein
LYNNNIMSIFYQPSFYSLFLTGIIYIIVLFLFVQNFQQIKKMEPIKMIQILSLIGILIGVHGLIHLGLESVYKFNPIQQLLR